MSYLVSTCRTYFRIFPKPDLTPPPSAPQTLTLTSLLNKRYTNYSCMISSLPLWELPLFLCSMLLLSYHSASNVIPSFFVLVCVCYVHDQHQGAPESQGILQSNGQRRWPLHLCTVLSCPVLSCPILPYPTLPYPAFPLPCCPFLLFYILYHTVLCLPFHHTHVITGAFNSLTMQYAIFSMTIFSYELFLPPSSFLHILPPFSSSFSLFFFPNLCPLPPPLSISPLTTHHFSVLAGTETVSDDVNATSLAILSSKYKTKMLTLEECKCCACSSMMMCWGWGWGWKKEERGKTTPLHFSFLCSIVSYLLSALPCLLSSLLFFPWSLFTSLSWSCSTPSLLSSSVSLTPFNFSLLSALSSLLSSLLYSLLFLLSSLSSAPSLLSYHSWSTEMRWWRWNEWWRRTVDDFYLIYCIL